MKILKFNQIPQGQDEHYEVLYKFFMRKAGGVERIKSELVGEVMKSAFVE